LRCAGIAETRCFARIRCERGNLAILAFGLPRANVVVDVVTCTVPESPAAIGCVALAMVTFFCVVIVPKSVPETVPVIPISSNSCESRTITGFITVRNFVVTFGGETVSETTTTFLPFASAVTAAAANFTTTLNPRFISRVLIAASTPFKVVLPTTVYSYQTKENINSKFLISVIDDFCRYVEKPTVLVLGNAPVHRSKVFQDQLERWQELDLYIFFLPRYCLHLNKAERFWQKAKYEWLKPSDYFSFAKYERKIKEIFSQIGLKYKVNFKELKDKIYFV
jgi:transposase